MTGRIYIIFYILLIISTSLVELSTSNEAKDPCIHIDNNDDALDFVADSMNSSDVCSQCFAVITGLFILVGNYIFIMLMSFII